MTIDLLQEAREAAAIMGKQEQLEMFFKNLDLDLNNIYASSEEISAKAAMTIKDKQEVRSIETVEDLDGFIDDIVELLHRTSRLACLTGMVIGLRVGVRTDVSLDEEI